MKNTALLLIDFQNDYFSSFDGACFPLNGIEEASSKALKILNHFRKNNLKLIHIRHEFEISGPFFKKGTRGASIHESVKPIEKEVVITKNYANSFKNTNLKEVLESLNVKSLIIVGAMSHMCIDACTRVAKDYGYDCTVVSDACATRDLEFEGEIIPSNYVHGAFMAALGASYAKIVKTENILKELSNR